MWLVGYVSSFRNVGFFLLWVIIETEWDLSEYKFVGDFLLFETLLAIIFSCFSILSKSGFDTPFEFDNFVGE